jgi:hypothetical protein
MARPFVFNDESIVNDRGFILLNAGIDLARFKANPVMLRQHDPEHVVGRWDNIRIEGTKLLADPVFDEEDDDAKKLKGQVDREFVKGASPWIVPLEAELREVPTLGYLAVVTKSELMEGSIVSIPSNALSLRLSSRDGKILESNDEIKLAIESITINKQSPETMEKVILTPEALAALAVTATPDGAALSAAIVKLAADKTTAETANVQLAADKKTAEDALKAHLSAQAKALVDGAIAEGRLTAEKKDSFMKLAESDLKQAQELISSIPPKTTLSSQVKPAGSSAGEDRSGWDYMRWAKEDPKGLTKLAAEKPEEFNALKEAYKPKH